MEILHIFQNTIFNQEYEFDNIYFEEEKSQNAQRVNIKQNNVHLVLHDEKLKEK